MKDIPGYKGLYAITSCGKVWSYKTNKFLKPHQSRGYLVLRLFKNGVGKSYSIHRLVAITYIPNLNNLPDVNHKNEIKTDNYIGNLEWCTKQYNKEYSAGKPVLCIETGTVYRSARRAMRELGIKSGALLNCLGGWCNTCMGYHWEYLDKRSHL